MKDLKYAVITHNSALLVPDSFQLFHIRMLLYQTPFEKGLAPEGMYVDTNLTLNPTPF